MSTSVEPFDRTLADDMAPDSGWSSAINLLFFLNTYETQLKMLQAFLGRSIDQLTRANWGQCLHPLKIHKNESLALSH
jgi:hypothetical protein